MNNGKEKNKRKVALKQVFEVWGDGHQAGPSVLKTGGLRILRGPQPPLLLPLPPLSPSTMSVQGRLNSELMSLHIFEEHEAVHSLFGLRNLLRDLSRACQSGQGPAAMWKLSYLSHWQVSTKEITSKLCLRTVLDQMLV